MIHIVTCLRTDCIYGNTLASVKTSNLILSKDALKRMPITYSYKYNIVLILSELAVLNSVTILIVYGKFDLRQTALLQALVDVCQCSWNVV